MQPTRDGPSDPRGWIYLQGVSSRNDCCRGAGCCGCMGSFSVEVSILEMRREEYSGKNIALAGRCLLACW